MIKTKRKEIVGLSLMGLGGFTLFYGISKIGILFGVAVGLPLIILGYYLSKKPKKV